MSNALHSQQTYVEGIHSIVSYIYTSSSDRTSATGFSSVDLHKVAFQSSDNTYWTLIGTGSSWQQLNGSSSGGGSGGGDPAPTYLVLSTTSSLSQERLFSVSGTSGLKATDGGANGTYSLSINDNVVATLSGSIFSGPVSASAGLSGSLQQVGPGLPYLLAQGALSITTQSNGQIILSASGGGVGPAGPAGSSVFVDGGNKLKTTSSVAISGPDNLYVDGYGTDVFFYVSGTVGLSGSSAVKRAVFGGDVLYSASLLVSKTIAFVSEVNLGNKGSASTLFDFRLGQKLRATLTGSLTASFVDPPGASSILMTIVQDSTGNRTIKWPASVKWPTSGTIPTLSTQPNSLDIVSFYFNGSGSYYGVATLQFL